jgi:hypothetical protein
VHLLWLLLAVQHGDEKALAQHLDIAGALSPVRARKAGIVAARCTDRYDDCSLCTGAAITQAVQT